jgi:hypothetical protein
MTANFNTWQSDFDYNVGATVSHGIFLFRARRYVPAGTPLTNTFYWMTQGDGITEGPDGQPSVDLGDAPADGRTWGRRDNDWFPVEIVGLTSVFHDGSLSGSGTVADPLSVNSNLLPIPRVVQITGSSQQNVMSQAASTASFARRRFEIPNWITSSTLTKEIGEVTIVPKGSLGAFDGVSNNSEEVRVGGFVADSIGNLGRISTMNELSVNVITLVSRNIADTITDAPSNGELYGRKNGGWVRIPPIPELDIITDCSLIGNGTEQNPLAVDWNRDPNKKYYRTQPTTVTVGALQAGTILPPDATIATVLDMILFGSTSTVPSTLYITGNPANTNQLTATTSVILTVNVVQGTNPLIGNVTLYKNGNIIEQKTVTGSGAYTFTSVSISENTSFTASITDGTQVFTSQAYSYTFSTPTYVAPTISITSAVPPRTGTFYTGTTYTITAITVNIVQGSNPLIGNITINRSGTAVATYPAPANGGSVTINTNIDITTNTTITATVSDGTQTATSAGYSYTFQNPVQTSVVFYGIVDQAIPTENDILTAPNVNQIQAIHETQTHYLNGWGYAVFVFPKAWGVLKNIKDENNFEMLNGITRRELTFEIDGVNIDYYAYTQDNMAFYDEFPYTFIWA